MEPPSRPSIRNLNPRESSLLIRERSGDSDFVILDVRTPQEHGMGRIEGSVNIDYHSPVFEAELEKLERSKTYLVYLAGWRRAEREGPTLQGGDESGALCPGIRLLITI
jgi:hypothetical protein